MDNYDESTQQAAGETAENLKEHAEHVCGQVKDAVCDVCGKTAHVASETINHAKSFTTHNPGKSVLIALGAGVVIGMLLGARSHHRHSRGRFAQPVVGALSDIALEFFR